MDPLKVHLLDDDGYSVCGRHDEVTTHDEAKVTCKRCRYIAGLDK